MRAHRHTLCKLALAGLTAGGVIFSIGLVVVGIVRPAAFSAVSNQLLGAVAGSVFLATLLLTAWKRWVRDAKASDVKFQSLLQASPDAVVITNRKGQIVLTNPQAVKLFGYTPEEMQGQA